MSIPIPENALSRPVSWCSVFEHNTRMTPRSAEIVTILLYLIIPGLSVAVLLCLPDLKTRRFKLPWNPRLYGGYVDSDPSRHASAIIWSFCIASVLLVLCITSIVFQALSILEWNFCAPTPLREGVYVFVWVFFVLLSVIGTLLAFLAWAFLLKMLVRPSQADLLAERRSSSHINLRLESDPEMGHVGSTGDVVERSGRVSANGPVSVHRHRRDPSQDSRNYSPEGQERRATSPLHASHTDARGTSYPQYDRYPSQRDSAH